MSHPHEEGASQGKKSSKLRLVLLAIIMLGIAGLAWVPSLFFRGGGGQAIGHTATDVTVIFIPAWLIMTIGVVAASFYFSKRLLEAERNRDAEPVRSSTPSHH